MSKIGAQCLHSDFLNNSTISGAIEHMTILSWSLEPALPAHLVLMKICSFPTEIFTPQPRHPFCSSLWSPDSFPLADWALWHHSDSFCFALFILLLSFSILCLYDIISAYFLLMHPYLLICLLISFTQHLTQPLPFAYSLLLSLLPILYKFLANFLPST